MSVRKFSFVLLMCCISVQISLADVRMPAIFSDNMVLQQKSEVAVWGWAESGEKVTVKGSWHDSQDKTTLADDNGKWMVKVGTPGAGGPYKLEIKGENTTVFDNVMTGEVWLCSGQSNMWMPLSGLPPEQPIEGSGEEIKNSDYPMIRLFTVKQKVEATPVDDCEGRWQECSPESAKDFSAVGYFFGKQLYKELNIPIGLIHSSWGGTVVEAWTKREIINNDPHMKSVAEKIDKEFEQWQEEIRKAKADNTPEPPIPGDIVNCPSYLYNGMINPIIPYGIKGAIWYQGESNAGRAYQYRELFPAMIENWRTDWGRGDFPFYFVQLASYFHHQPGVSLDVKKGEPAGDAWAELRGAQLLTLKRVNNTGMVVAIDIGEANNIHPPKKKEVGQRLALWALAKDYGKEIAYSGPLYQSMSIEGDKMRISFDYAKCGLDVKGDTLDGFAVSGADKKFVWANAKIENDTVIVWNDKVKEPVAARYAWAIYPFCNLYNKAGLPASPFRTDDWPGLTINNK